MLTITPNRRLAIHLGKNEPAIKSHERRRVYPLQEWVLSLWEQWKTRQGEEQRQEQAEAQKHGQNEERAKENTPTLLTPYEEDYLWEKIIAESPFGQTCLQIKPLIPLCKTANEMIQKWRISSFSSFYEHEESLHFLEWWKAYHELLAKNGWLDHTSLLNFMIQQLPFLFRSQILPSKMEWFGFTEFTPEEMHLIENLQQLGIKITLKNLSVKPIAILRCAFSSSDEELQQVATMAKSWLEKDPSADIGIVILDLEKRRPEVEDVFQSTFSKESINIAAPFALAKNPIINAAFLGLALTSHAIPLEKISRFLRSPFFWGAKEELAYRVMLDVYLHDLKISHYSVERLLQLLQSQEEIKAPLLSQCLEKFIALKLECRGRKKPLEWAPIVQQLLDSIGWAHDSIINQDERVTKEAWEKGLLAYSELGKILPLQHFSEVKYHLENLIKKTIFTPPRKKANIHVLGLLEAVGIPFDYLWCLGFTGSAWPRMPSPNPFIPLSLQCKLNLPRSHVTRELQMAKQYTHALCQGSKNDVIFSYVSQGKENRSERLSSLIKQVAEEICFVKGNKGYKESKENIENKKNKETYSLHYNKEQKVAPSHSAQASLRALALQAECPFKAFSEIRLKATTFAKPPDHLTKSERGEILHEILFLFWKEISSQEDLLKLSNNDLILNLRSKIDKVISRWENRFPKRLTPRYMQLERFRSEKILCRFVELEKRRPNFKIHALELQKMCTIGPLSFPIRIDRIDRLDSLDKQGEKDELLLLDYKTGQARVSGWFETPLQEPQLPLYCMANDATPIGITYAVLRSNDLKYQGIAKHTLGISGIKSLQNCDNSGNDDYNDNNNGKESLKPWESLCQTWQVNLEKTAQDFNEGVADVHPHKGEETCRRCQLHGLCRIRS